MKIEKTLIVALTAALSLVNCGSPTAPPPADIAVTGRTHTDPTPYATPGAYYNPTSQTNYQLDPGQVTVPVDQCGDIGVTLDQNGNPVWGQYAAPISHRGGPIVACAFEVCPLFNCWTP